MNNHKHENPSSFSHEITKILEKLNKQKDSSLKSLEEFKNSIVQNFDRQIDKIYKRRQLLKETRSRKKELKGYKVSVCGRIKRGGLLKLLKGIIGAPFIYMMIIPALIMHLFLEIYHQVCFRLFKIPIVKAKEYFVFDRGHLPYLNFFEKINCLYCSYFNCLVAYVQEVAGRTERYWCPIKHAKRVKGSHSQYSKFCDFSDAKSLESNWQKIRGFDEVRK